MDLLAQLLRFETAFGISAGQAAALCQFNQRLPIPKIAPLQKVAREQRLDHGILRVEGERQQNQLMRIDGIRLRMYVVETKIDPGRLAGFCYAAIDFAGLLCAAEL